MIKEEFVTRLQLRFCLHPSKVRSTEAFAANKSHYFARTDNSMTPSTNSFVCSSSPKTYSI